MRDSFLVFMIFPPVIIYRFIQEYVGRDREPNHADASWKDAPQPLPEMRPRSLTDPLPEKTDPRSRWQKLVARVKPVCQQRINEQRQSPLARLPPEVRLLIWKHLLCGQQLHMVCAKRHSKTSRGRLVGIKCSEGPTSFPCANHHCWGRVPLCRGVCVAMAREPRWYRGQFGNSAAEEVNFVALLRTCRLM